MIPKIDLGKQGDKVVIERGKKFICVVLECAWYRALIISLLFWRYLVRKLKPRGFQSNPYEPCVMNKVVDGNSYTLCWPWMVMTG